MKVEFLLSKNLIKPIFTILLAIGATIGIACLLVVLSLFENYYLSVEKVFMGIHPHIEIHKEGMSEDAAEIVIQKLKNDFPSIGRISSAIYKKVFIEIAETDVVKAFCVSRDENQVCYDGSLENSNIAQNKILTRFGFEIKKREMKEVLLKGIDVQSGEVVIRLESILTGYPDFNRLELNKDQNNNVLPMAFYMEGISPQAILDDYLIGVPKIAKERPQHFRLRGTLELGRKKGSLPLFIISLENAQNLLNQAGLINTIEIEIEHPYDSAGFANRIRDSIGQEYTVLSWTEKERASFAFLKITKSIIFALLFSVSVVAAISVYSTLLLAVLQNQKKISILKALGMKNSSIYTIFISSALIIGIFGLFSGFFLGYSGSELLIKQFAESLTKLGIENPKTEITIGDLAITTLLTLTLFGFTAVFPARRAVAVDPIENLQS